MVSTQARGLAAPLEGPPSVECGLFPELPKFRLGAQSSWDVNEEGRTPRTWRVDGTESMHNVPCVRLCGMQQSEDWTAPRADRASWQRLDTAWVSPHSGLTSMYERIIKRRDPAREAPTHRSTLRCELEGGLTYHGNLLDDRLKEINQARKFSKDAESWLHAPQQHKAALETLLKKMKQYCDTEAPTPYRKAILQTQKRIEAALRGETIPNPAGETTDAPAPSAAVGQRIPDFICTDLMTRQTLRLHKVLGKPVVVAFYRPATEGGNHILQLGRTLAQRYPRNLTILPMAVTDDPDEARRQHKDMNLPFSIIDGRGLLQLFGVDALPRVVVLDEQGVVRQTWTGWGVHTPDEVNARVRELIVR